VLEDRNAGARLSAMEALAARAAEDGAVRRAMIEALQRDANPGVRVRAIDLLAAAPHPDVIPALRRLAREDRNAYVRIRAAALIGETAGGDR
jgi:HEAT repeat protein